MESSLCQFMILLFHGYLRIQACYVTWYIESEYTIVFTIVFQMLNIQCSLQSVRALSEAKTHKYAFINIQYIHELLS